MTSKFSIAMILNALSYPILHGKNHNVLGNEFVSSPEDLYEFSDLGSGKIGGPERMGGYISTSLASAIQSKITGSAVKFIGLFLFCLRERFNVPASMLISVFSLPSLQGLIEIAISQRETFRQQPEFTTHTFTYGCIFLI
jgi:hypothetical protein